MKDKSKLTAIILVIITVCVVIFSLITKPSDKEKQSQINIVKNYSNFYTVNSCLYRFVTYLSSEDSKSAFLILSDEYKDKNNVTEANILKKFASVGANSTFVSKKMYYEKINAHITKYYVYGIIQPNQLFDGDYISKIETNDIYFIVYLDSESKTFSVEPYSGDIFIGGEEYE